MQSFRTIRPTAVLTPYIKYYWVLQNSDPGVVSERIFSTGSIQVTFHKGKQLYSLTDCKLQPQVFVCGHSIGYSDVVSTGDIEMITIVFQPYAAKMFFRLPVYEFRGQQLSADDIGDVELSDLAKHIADTPDNDTCIYLIESFLMTRLMSLSSYHLHRISDAISQVNTHAHTTISQLSDTACLSTKQFGRVFAEYVGTTPKEFMRIVRVQRTLYAMQLQPDIDFAQLACVGGFFDQSHLIKEFKLFSGYTPAEYISVCSPYSDYFSVI